MRTLNLDSMFVPVPYPEIHYTLKKYSGGEMNICLHNGVNYTFDKVVITHRIKSADDIMSILIAKDALQIKGIRRFDLIIPYLPYARQDRICHAGESFSLKVFSKLINAENFETVYVVDTHSNVGPALINNCANIESTEYVERALKHIDIFGINAISPDAGSFTKVSTIYNSNRIYFNKLISCSKLRDKDGSPEIEIFHDDFNNEPCLIIDDICDGGRTFIETAKKLKGKNAGNIYLYVTHGIFSYGFDELNKYFKQIYCTNSFSDISANPNVTQFKIQL